MQEAYPDCYLNFCFDIDCLFGISYFRLLLFQNYKILNIVNIYWYIYWVLVRYIYLPWWFWRWRSLSTANSGKVNPYSFLMSFHNGSIGVFGRLFRGNEPVINLVSAEVNIAWSSIVDITLLGTLNFLWIYLNNCG